MEDIIYKLDNWTIIKIVGGVGVVIGSIFILLSNILIERIKVKWSQSAEKELEEIKFKLEKNNSTIENLESNLLFQVQSYHTKRIEAIEKIWLYFLDIKNAIPDEVYTCLAILQDNEITNQGIDKSDSIKRNLRIEVENNRSSKEFYKISQGLEVLKPFLDQDLYNLIKLYQTSISRITYLFIKQYNEGSLNGWKSDKNVLLLMKEILSKEELDLIIGTQIGSFNDFATIVEIKLLEKIKYSLTGVKFTKETIEHLKKIQELYKEAKEK